MAFKSLEAMSYGIVVLSKQYKMKIIEVVGNYAVSFKKGDVEDLRSKMEELLMHPERVRKHKEEK